MNKKLNVASVAYPNDRPSQDEWVNEFRVSSGYIAPTPYFTGNEFDTQIFLGQSPGSKLSWQRIFTNPINIILNYTNQL
jgi:hypothetical protein